MRLTHQEDLAAGNGAVYLPGALDRKYLKAAREWGLYACAAAGGKRDDKPAGLLVKKSKV